MSYAHSFLMQGDVFVLQGPGQPRLTRSGIPSSAGHSKPATSFISRPSDSKRIGDDRDAGDSEAESPERPKRRHRSSIEKAPPIAQAAAAAPLATKAPATQIPAAMGATDMEHLGASGGTASLAFTLLPVAAVPPGYALIILPKTLQQYLP